MTGDHEMADLLADAPPTEDARFRIDVLLRTAARRRRRVAIWRGVRWTAAFAALGLMFPLLRAFGLTLADAQPLLTVAGVLALAYLLAFLTIEGPGAVLARSRRALLRVQP